MQLFRGASFCVTLVSFAILGFYAMNNLIFPGGLPLPAFHQRVTPSLPTASRQQELPTSMIIHPTLADPPDAANSTTLLFPDSKTTVSGNQEVVMVASSDSKTKGLEPSPPGKMVSNNNNTGQSSEGEKSTNRKDRPISQRNGNPQPGWAEDYGADEQNVSTTSNDDLGFQVEDTNAWLGLKEHMSDSNNEAYTGSPSSVAALHEEEIVVNGGGGRDEASGVETLPPFSSSAPTPAATPTLLHNRIIQVANIPWLPKVATVLSRCAYSAPFRIYEYLANKPCQRNCSGNGVCNYDIAMCRCFHGYTGAACGLTKDFECNMESPSDVVIPREAFGPWLPSICSATCDKRKGFCYCGEGTKYPRRPTTEQCGFPKISGTDFTFDWNVRDRDIFTDDNSRPGWCNVDPAEYYEGRAQKKETCYCIYDGTAGEFCQLPTQSTCVNQCSGNGFCRNGFCSCEEGWYGIDCSIPSLKASMKTWPSWLSSDTVRGDDGQPSEVYQDSNKMSVPRHRPLIYVYDLPAQFNSLLLEGRHFKFHCVNRVYDALNWTMWAEALYGAEIAFLESLLASEHRTNNAAEADFFYVPVLGACAIARAADSPHMDIQKHYGIRPYFAGDIYYKRAYQHIRMEYPYWDRYKGRDHIWMFPWDEGACVSPKEIWNSMMLVHWGNTNSKYNYSTTAYGSDNWNIVPKSWRGNHPCYDPEKDLVLPSWKDPTLYVLSQRLWTRKIDQRPILFYFRGNLGSKYKQGRPEPEFVPSISRLVKRYYNELEGSF